MASQVLSQCILIMAMNSFASGCSAVSLSLVVDRKSSGVLGLKLYRRKYGVVPVELQLLLLYVNSRRCSHSAQLVLSDATYAWSITSSCLFTISVCLSCCGWCEEERDMHVLNLAVTAFQKSGKTEMWRIGVGMRNMQIIRVGTGRF
jgi:hypothetical protein